MASALDISLCSTTTQINFPIIYVCFVTINSPVCMILTFTHEDLANYTVYKSISITYHLPNHASTSIPDISDVVREWVVLVLELRDPL